MLEVTVSRLDGEKASLRLEEGATVAEVKLQLTALWGAQPEEQRLIADDLPLADEHSLPPDCRHLQYLRVQACSVYVVGGLGAEHSALGIVERMELPGGSWEEAPPIRSPRRFCAVAALHGMLYVVGGCDAAGRPLASVECLAPPAQQWRELPPMPAGPRYACAAAARGPHLYAVGGGDDEGHLAVAERLEPKSERWEELPLMAGGPRRGCAAATVAGSLYVVGGMGGAAPLRPMRRVTKGYPLRSAERFDHATGSWQVLPPMATKRRGCAAAGLGGCLYVVGGGDGLGHILASVERFVPAAGAWEELAPMAVPRYGCAAVAAAELVCVFGGSSGDRSVRAASDCVLGACECLDPKTGQWQALPGQIVARHSCGAAGL